METFQDDMTVRISKAASVALDTPIEELPPLSEAINPDALAALFSSTPDDSSNLTVTFTYAGLHVSVHSDTTVYVQDIREEDDYRSGLIVDHR